MKTISIITSLRISLTFILLSLSSALANTNVTATKLIHLTDLTKLSNIDKIKPIEEKQKALIYFWAEWCPDCKQKLKGELKNWHLEKGVQVFTINRDKRTKRAEKFIKKYGIELPVYLDKSKKISIALKALSVPHWAVVQYTGKAWEVLKIGSGALEPAKVFFKDKLNKATK